MGDELDICLVGKDEGGREKERQRYWRICTIVLYDIDINCHHPLTR